MPANTTPLRPGANSTVPAGLPFTVLAAGTPGDVLHTTQLAQLEEVHLWVETASVAGDVDFEVLGLTPRLQFVFAASTDNPIKVFDGIPMRGGGTIAAFATGIQVAQVHGHVVRGTNRRPLQPVKTATPTGAPVAIATAAAGGTVVHTLDAGQIDEVHLWLHNPTKVNILNVITRLSPNAAGTGGSIYSERTGVANTTVKILDGVCIRGDTGVAQTIAMSGGLSANMCAFGYFIRR